MMRLSPIDIAGAARKTVYLPPILAFWKISTHCTRRCCLRFCDACQATVSFAGQAHPLQAERPEVARMTRLRAELEQLFVDAAHEILAAGKR